MAAHDISSIEAVQNSAFGALLLWSFGRGAQDEDPSQLPLFHLSFLVLPIVMHRSTLEVLTGTNKTSGLGKFIEKFAGRREDLMAIHLRALSMRKLTLEAMSTGIASGLLSVIYDQGLVRANDASVRRPTERIKPYVMGADKLGRWIARVPPATAFSLLMVRP